MKCFENENKGAIFSNDGKQRYYLWRIWDGKKPIAMCIGLNPSTANAEKDDATIGILKRMLTKLGYGGFYMVNCYSFITSNPKELLQNVTTIDFCINDNYLEQVAAKCSDVIFAWGTFKMVSKFGRDKELIKGFPNAKCFGFSKSGAPIHPLAMMYNGKQQTPELFNYLNKNQ